MPLTAKQNTYLAIAWQCMDTEPKINYNHFKTLAGLASAASARELLRVTRKKLREEYGATAATLEETSAGSGTVDGEGQGKATGTPKGARARAGMSTPASGGRKRKGCGRKKGDVMGSDDDGKEDGSEVPESPVVKKAKKMRMKKPIVVKQEKLDDDLVDQGDSDEELL